ncbi:MAG: hypothetical protein N3A58_03085 [Spirochaetes bacterium]|nr:hypothetical protein [Spirochaetota bacterium]
MPKIEEKRNFVYIKTFKTLALSTTGEFCKLNCPHCRKHYIKKMFDISKFSEYKTNFESDLYDNNYINSFFNYNSFLISGGMNKDLEIPIEKFENFYLFLKKNKKLINFHTGFLKEEKFYIFRYADAISLDLIFSNEAIKNIYKTKKTKKDYIKYLDSVINFCEKENIDCKIVPHITIGLNFGAPSEEKDLIKYISNYKNLKMIDKIVLNILKPNTNISFYYSPDINYSKEIIVYARSMLNKKLIFLGCMRPSGKYRKEIDKFSLIEGIDGIVNPSFEYRPEYSLYENCCSLFSLGL